MTTATEQAQQRSGWAAERRVNSYQPGPTPNRRWTDDQQFQTEESAGRRARGLGWFSIALGLAQIGAPRTVARLIGIDDDEETRNTMFAIGLREITSGIGILARPRPAGWVWSRVGGDVMDLALLGKAMSQDENDRSRLTAATAAVLGVAVLDFMTGQQLSRGPNGSTSSKQYDSRLTRKGAGQRRGIHVKQAVSIKRPRTEVYAFWRNFENLPRFMAHLESVQVTDNRRSHWKAKAPAGNAVEWDAEIVEERPNELIVWRSLPDAGVPNTGSVRFRDAPGDRGTEVLVELDYQAPGGKLGSLVAKLFGEEPEQQVKGDLRRFKQVMETGEILHSDASIHRGPHPAVPPENLDDVELLGTRQAVRS